MKAVDYLTNASIDPHPFADFLYLTGNGEREDVFELLSTHPSSKERLEYVLEEIGKRQFEVKPVIARMKTGITNFVFRKITWPTSNARKESKQP